MDPDPLIDLFSEFGPITLKRAFSGYAISADGVNFAMSLKSGIIMRVDEETLPRYEAEGARPFSYSTSKKAVVVKSYRHLPERLYDDPEELAVWAREAVGAAHRAKLKKSAKSVKRAPKRTGAASKSKRAKKPTLARASKR